MICLIVVCFAAMSVLIRARQFPALSRRRTSPMDQNPKRDSCRPLLLLVSKSGVSLPPRIRALVAVSIPGITTLASNLGSRHDLHPGSRRGLQSGVPSLSPIRGLGVALNPGSSIGLKSGLSSRPRIRGLAQARVRGLVFASYPGSRRGLEFGGHYAGLESGSSPLASN